MIIEVNGHIIDISQINWIGPVHGIREHNWFKFSVNGKEFEWEAQYRDAIVKPFADYHKKLSAFIKVDPSTGADYSVQFTVENND